MQKMWTFILLLNDASITRSHIAPAHLFLIRRHRWLIRATAVVGNHTQALAQHSTNPQRHLVSITFHFYLRNLKSSLFWRRQALLRRMGGGGEGERVAWRLCSNKLFQGSILSASKRLLIAPETRCFSGCSHSSGKSRLTSSCPWSPQSTQTQSQRSSSACGRCRTKYPPGDRLTALPDKNIAPAIGSTSPGTKKKSRRATVLCRRQILSWTSAIPTGFSSSSHVSR